jgi:hypothetical protein
VTGDVVVAWAALALGEGAGEAAARILGYSSSVRGVPLPPTGDIAMLAGQVTAEIGVAAYDAAYGAGAALERDLAIDGLLAWAGLAREQLDAMVVL